MDVSKNVVTTGDVKFVAFLGEEIDRTGCGLFCGVELLVVVQQSSELDQASFGNL